MKYLLVGVVLAGGVVVTEGVVWGPNAQLTVQLPDGGSRTYYPGRPDAGVPKAVLEAR